MFRLVELPVEIVTEDEARFPESDHSYVWEHLLYYCSLFEQLPAIQIRVERSGPVVTSRHKYLRVARALARAKVRAVIEPTSDQRAVEALVAHPGVRELDWKAVLSDDTASPLSEGWWVFFFERPLTAEEKKQFELKVVGFMDSLRDMYPHLYTVPVVSEVRYDDMRSLARIRASLPVGDDRWFSSYFQAIRDFSNEYVRIVSYQGERWS